MELARYARVLRRWWLLWLPGTLLAGGLAYWIARLTPPVYEARTTLLIAVSTNRESAYEDGLLNQQLVNTYVHVAVMPFVLDEAARRIDLHATTEDLRSRVRAEPAGAGSALFTITGMGPTPAEAEHLANAVAQAFIEQQALQLDLPETANAVSVVQPARQPPEPARPRPLLDTLVGAVLGLVVLQAAVFGLDAGLPALLRRAWVAELRSKRGLDPPGPARLA